MFIGYLIQVDDTLVFSWPRYQAHMMNSCRKIKTVEKLLQFNSKIDDVISIGYKNEEERSGSLTVDSWNVDHEEEGTHWMIYS